MEQYRVNKVWVDDTHVRAETQNGWKANYPFSRWSKLANATQEQRKDFVLSRYGIHWPEIDEDLCFEGLFADAGFCKETDKENELYYQAHLFIFYLFFMAHVPLFRSTESFQKVSL